MAEFLFAFPENVMLITPSVVQSGFPRLLSLQRGSLAFWRYGLEVH